MSRALVRCAKCQVRKYESEVIWDSVVKDFVCREALNCEKQLSKVRGSRMGATNLSTRKENVQSLQRKGSR